MKANTDFGKWLAEELRQRRWDQLEIRRQGGLTSAQISRIISGERKPGPTACVVIARALGLPPEEVFRRAGLLPPAREPVEGTRDLVYLFEHLDEEDRQRLLLIARVFWEKKQPK
ncbi:MAG: helix-turn-helix domain-containing protein [Armatimonadota bacterium]